MRWRIAQRERRLVQNAQHRQAAFDREPPQQAHDLLGGFRIEARHRLVGEDELRALRQRARDRGALRLAARQGVGALSAEAARRRPLRRQLMRHAAVPRRGRPPSAVHSVRRRPSVPLATLASTLRRLTRLARWNTIASASRASRSARPLSRAMSWPPTSTSPSVGSLEPRDASQQRRLAAAVAAEDRHQFAGRAPSGRRRRAPACRSGSACAGPERRAAFRHPTSLPRALALTAC